MKTYPLLIFVGMVVVGCKKYVTVPPPTTQLVTSTTFSSSSAATAAVMNIYINMMTNNESWNLASDNGLLSDELVTLVPNTNIYPFYINALTAVASPGPWKTGFNYIYQANAVIEGLSEYRGVSRAVSSELIGEAEFIRAFWLFILTNCYGDIPLPLSTNFYINSVLPRTDRDSVYGQIIRDLVDAKSRLSVNFLDADDTSISTERVRPTRWAAMALLARVKLFAGDYNDAFQESDSVISNNTLFSLTSLDSVFLANSNEAIWQLMIPQPTYTYATPDGNRFILIGAPGATPFISKHLYNSFESGDLRQSEWIGSFVTTSPTVTTYFFPFKYKVKTGQMISEYEMVLRLGEQYLIRAEAEAELGKLSSAIADLNLIRARAGLTGTVASTKMSLLNAIFHERQVEMFTEWGSRWFDLIRTGQIGPVMDTVASTKGGQWTLDDTLYPIPLSELNADPKLAQNPGYNN